MRTKIKAKYPNTISAPVVIPTRQNTIDAVHNSKGALNLICFIKYKVYLTFIGLTKVRFV